MTLDGVTPPRQLTEADVSLEPQCLAFDPSTPGNVYWLEYRGDRDSRRSDVELNPARPLVLPGLDDGGRPLPLVAERPGVDTDTVRTRYYSCVAADETHLYYSARERDARSFGLLTGRDLLEVYARKKGTWETTRIGNGTCLDLLVDDGSLYCRTATSLLRIPKTGPGGTELWSRSGSGGPLTTRALARDGEWLYLGVDQDGERNAGFILKLSTRGGAPTTVAKALWGLKAIAVTSTHVAWAQGPGGSRPGGVYRVAKP